MILPGTRNPDLEEFLKQFYRYRFDELWTGKIPPDCRAVWNAMSTAWKVKIGGWGHDAKWIETAIRARCRDFLISQHSIEVARGIFRRAIPPAIKLSPWAYYTVKCAPITGLGAFTGFSLAAGALLYGLYWGGLFGSPYGPPPEFHEWIDPTIMVNDNMDTGKEPELIPSHKSVRFQLIPGAGLAGSKALRITFQATSESGWRNARIRYRFPGPLRQFVLCGFNLRHLSPIPLVTAEFFVHYTSRRRRSWAGFNFNFREVKYPWTLVQPPPQHFFPIDPGRKPISEDYAPAWFEFDTENSEYTKLNTFGQIHNVKGEPILLDTYTKPQPGELNLLFWHPWAEELVLELDAVLLYEYGPYRNFLLRELRQRENDFPIEEKLPSGLA